MVHQQTCRNAEFGRACNLVIRCHRIVDEERAKVVLAVTGQQVFECLNCHLHGGVTIRVNRHLPAIVETGLDRVAHGVRSPVGVATIVFTQVRLHEVARAPLVRTVGRELPGVCANHLVATKRRDAGVFPRLRDLAGRLSGHDGEL